MSTPRQAPAARPVPVEAPASVPANVAFGFAVPEPPVRLQVAYGQLMLAVLNTAADPQCIALQRAVGLAVDAEVRRAQWEQRFGPVVSAFLQTLRRVVAEDASARLAYEALGVALAGEESVMPTLDEALAYGLSAAISARACEVGADAEQLAFDAIRFATTPEAVYRWLFAAATIPNDRRTKAGIDQVAAGRIAVPTGHPLYTAFFDALGVQAVSQVASTTRGVRVDVSSTLPIVVEDTLTLRDQSTVGMANGRLDLGDSAAIELRYRNVGSDWLFSESIAFRAISDCAIARTAGGEQVLAESAPGSRASFALPEIYLSAGCTSEVSAEFMLTSSSTPESGVVRVSLSGVTANAQVSVADWDEDEPGFSGVGEVGELGANDRAEVRLQVTGPVERAQFRVSNYAMLPRGGQSLATLIGARPMGFRTSGRGVALSEEDLDVMASGDVPFLTSSRGATTALDAMPVVWLRLDLRASFVGRAGSAPRVREAMAARPGETQTLMSEWGRVVGQLVETVWLADTQPSISATLALIRSGMLDDAGVARALQTIDLLRCEGCDSAAGDREWARRALIVMAAVQLRDAGYALPAEPIAFWSMSAVRGVGRLEQAMADALLERLELAQQAESDGAMREEALSVVQEARGLAESDELIGADYRFVRYVAIPLTL